MIVLTESQVNFLNGFKDSFRQLMQERKIDFNPVKILSGDYILPEKLLIDEDFKEIKQALIDGGHLNNLIIRDILPSELIIDTSI